MRPNFTIFRFFLTIIFSSMMMATNAQITEQRDSKPAEPKHHPDAIELTGSRSEQIDVEITVQVDWFYSEASWNVWDVNNGVYYFSPDKTFNEPNEEYTEVLSLSEGAYEVHCWDTWGDGGISGSVSYEYNDMLLLQWDNNDYDSYGAFSFDLQSDYPAPINLNASNDELTVTLSWDDPDYTNPPTEYNIYRDGVNIGSTSIQAYADIVPEVGQYDYFVTALNSGLGVESWPSESLNVMVEGSEIDIPDDNFRMVINEHLGYVEPESLNHNPTEGEMSTIVNLNGIGRSIEDITGAEYLINLQTMDLSDNSISDISPLEGLTTMVSLKLNDNAIEDISGLDNLINLTELALENNLVEDITSVSSLTSLEDLNLGNNEIVDISPLSGYFWSMTTLNLSGNNIESIAPLSNNTWLETLLLNDNEIVDITPLSDAFWSMTTLNLSGNNIESIVPLNNNLVLTTLFLNDNNIIDVSPLSALTGLRLLKLNNNSIENASAISNLTNLENLNLGSNEITDIAFLGGSFVNLSTLNLSGNNIGSIAPLGNNNALHTLLLNDNEIFDLKELVALANIQKLDLSNNKVSDIYYLTENEGLGDGTDSLNLQENPLSKEALQEHIPILTQQEFNELLYDDAFDSLAPCYPVPQRTETLFAFDDTLRWEANYSTLTGVEYDIYFGSDINNLALLESGVIPSQVPVTTNQNEQYFWRVETITANDTLYGGFWSFTTSEPPQLTLDADSINEDVVWGKDTTFYLNIENNSTGIVPLNYQFSFAEQQYSLDSKGSSTSLAEWKNKLLEKHQKLEKKAEKNAVTQNEERGKNETVFRDNNGDFLVIDPDGENNSGEVIEQLLTEMGYSVDYTNDFSTFTTYDYKAVFVTLGVYYGWPTTNYVLQESDVAGLTNYLDNGGNLYMEGGDTWFFDTPTSLHPYFFIDPIDDGASDLSVVKGINNTFTEGVDNAYNGHNSWIDRLAPTSESFTVLRNEDVGYDCGIAHEGSYKTIGTSFVFGGLEDSQMSKKMILWNMLDFFEQTLKDEWLTVIPSAGLVSSGEGESIEFRIDGSEIPGLGTFTKELVLTTNDPGNETTPFSVTINVDEIYIPNDNFRIVINEHLGYEDPETLTHNPTAEEMATLTELYGINRDIDDITGAEFLVNVTNLQLGKNNISDISHIEDLTGLTNLSLNGNAVSDISYLANLTNLENLNLSNVPINDFEPLNTLTNLGYLALENNAIQEVWFLEELINLQILNLKDNQIFDLRPVQKLNSLQQLFLENNYITDIYPLVKNMGLGDSENDMLNLEGNPLSVEAIEQHMPILEDRTFWVLNYNEYAEQLAPCYPEPARDVYTVADSIVWRANFEEIDNVVYDVYLGTSSDDLSLIEQALEDTTLVVDFENNQEYWWRIESHHNGNIYYSGVWHFANPMEIDSVIAENPLCYESNTGAITINVVGGVAPIEYSIDDGETWQEDNTFPELSAGTYMVKVLDAQDSLLSYTSNPVILENPEELIFESVESSDIVCYGETNGLIEISASGGSGEIMYSIDEGATWQSENQFTDLSAGDYMVMVKDTNNCQVLYELNPVNITEPDAVTINAVEVVDVEGCYGEATGEIQIDAAGGVGELMYSIDDGATWQSENQFTDLIAGQYNIQVKGGNECTTVYVSNPVVIDQPDELVINKVSTSDIACYGAAEGQIIITEDGGTGEISYSVDDGDTWQSDSVFTNLVAGEYAVFVKDDNSCITEYSENPVVIEQPDELIITEVDVQDASEYGANDGSITISAEGGTGDLVYSIDEGATWQDDPLFEGLGANSYVIVVKDANDCITDYYDNPVIIGQPPQLIIDEVISENVTGCYGNSNGTISINTSGTSNTVFHSIDDGDTWYENDGEFENLMAGDYYVKVKNEEDIIVAYENNPVTLSEPDEVVINSVSSQNITCFDGANGTIGITAMGGTTPLEYSVDGGTTWSDSGLFEGLVADGYQIQVRDANECTTVYEENPLTLTQPEAIEIAEVILTPISCYDANDAAIEIAANGGTGQLQYSIDGGINWLDTPLFANLSTGTYSVQVKDENNCISYYDNNPVVIENPEQLVIENVELQDPSCYGSYDGQISVQATGGSGTLMYSIDGGQNWQEENVFASLSSGEYSLVVKDLNDCQIDYAQNPVLLSDPFEIEVDIDVANVNCYGSSDGSITINALGGSGNFEYTIGDGWQSNNEFYNLSPGSYTVMVQDGNGCMVPYAGNPVFITQPEPLFITEVDFESPECYGADDGMITISSEGGSGEHLYSIDGGVNWQSENTFEMLAPGNYEVLVKDSNDCIKSYIDNPVVITEPESVEITGVAPENVSCFGYEDGMIEIFAEGGTGTLYFSIDDGATWQNLSLFEQLSPGEYNVVVKDDNECITSWVNNPIVIDEPLELVINSVTKEDVTCFGGSDGTITIEAEGGIGSISYSIDNGNDFQYDPEFVSLSAGEYYTVVKDGNECETIYSDNPVTINQPEALEVTVMAEPDSIACGNQIVTLTAEASLESSFTWEPTGQSGSSIEVDSTGIGYDSQEFTVYAETPEGCTASGSIMITFTNCTDINTLNNEVSVHVVPNPNNGRFTLTVEGLNKPFDIAIFDAIGNFVLHKKKVEITEDFYSEHYDLSAKQDGIYYIRILSKDGVFVKKIVITK